jgi:hypothetical protein
LLQRQKKSGIRQKLLVNCVLLSTNTQLSKRKTDFYYLLPGMGKGSRARYARNVKVSIAVGLLVSAGLGGLLYYMAQF